MRTLPGRKEKMHKGVDIPVRNVPVRAAYDGVVLRVKTDGK